MSAARAKGWLYRELTGEAPPGALES